MPDRRAARARLFLPFDALDGFRDHLAEKERPQESRKLLSEDDHVRIDHTLRQLKPGDMASIVWYAQGRHLAQRGMILDIDAARGTITIASTAVPINDIVDIRREE